MSRTSEERTEYADKLAQKIADKLKVMVVGIPVSGQATSLERID